jgi:hypothetical protein
MKKVALILILGLVLSGCAKKGGNSDSSDESTFGNGDYMSCVMELRDARTAGILDATDEEITAECSS